jgi:hypothetical protein
VYSACAGVGSRSSRARRAARPAEKEIVQAMREEVDRFIAERKAAQAAVAGGN